MRYPKPLKSVGTIGFIAPSFGCAIEPYESRFKNALDIFNKKGFRTYIGPNCYSSNGIGISNTPIKCAGELNRVMTDPEIDAVITCGGGELMCEVVPYMDFEAIAKAEPKWYMGYSDNTNYTFLSATLADTAAIYGPCAPAFGREPWHESVEDALGLLTGTFRSSHGYKTWESFDDCSDKDDEEPLKPYNAKTKTEYKYFNASANQASFKGRLLGGCMDILIIHCGTKYDRVKEFNEKYKEDGVIWFFECCDLPPLSMRRAFWQLREAGWLDNAKGFLIGRPLHYGEEQLGVNQYNAVTDILGDMNLPIIMDLDIGHLPPMMPLITGAMASVNAKDNNIKIDYDYV
jgi:muramoyltetrapeptide carboxypeptidase LdcA involved in peptidoglycan recycling